VQGRRSPLGIALLWAAGLLAFQPVLADLLQHWRVNPWARYSLVFVPLFVLSLVRASGASRPAPAPRAGVGWLAAGLALEVLSAAAGVVSVGRPGLALGLIGMARWCGLASYPAVFLALFIIPVPQVAIEALTGRAAVVAQFALVADLLRDWLPPMLVEWPLAATSEAQLRLRPPYAGVPLLVGMLGLGFYRTIRLRPGALSRPSAGLWLALRWSALALGVQGAALLASVLLLGAKRPLEAAVAVQWLPFTGIALAVAIQSEFQARRPRSAPALGGEATLSEPRRSLTSVSS